MAVSVVTTKFTGSLQVFESSASQVNRPDNIQVDFASQYRIENQVIPIAAGGSYTLTLASEGLTSADLIKIEVTTANMSATLRPDGDPAGFTIVPVTSEDRAFFIASATFATLVIGNPGAAAIDVAISVFQKQP